MANFKIKDADGNVINNIIADLAFVEANFEHYEEDVPVVVEPTEEELQAKQDSEARVWRDSELDRTDKFMTLPDYPYLDAMTIYRQELRDWTSLDTFPDTRPELNTGDK